MTQVASREIRNQTFRAVVAGLLIAFASIGAGIGVGSATLPSTDELQRASAEELGIEPDLLDHPLVVPILERVGERVRDRVVEEARASVVLAVATSAVVATAGVVLVAVVARRREVTG